MLVHKYLWNEAELYMWKLAKLYRLDSTKHLDTANCIALTK